jgi:hypothetical protein
MRTLRLDRSEESSYLAKVRMEAEVKSFGSPK